MKIKNCPFCGGEAELWNNKLTYRLYGVICEECDCMTPYFTTREEAIEAWNRREPMDKIVEQLEEYKNLECDDPNEDIDEEVEDAEELYDLGRSQGKLEAYLNAIELVKGGAV